MKMRLKQATTKMVDVDVQFPIYKKHDCSGDDYMAIIYTVLLEDGREISIHEDERHQAKHEWSIEVGRWYAPLNDDDYFMGRGQYASSFDEFHGKYQQMQDYMNTIRLEIPYVD